MGLSSSATGLRPGVCTSTTRPSAPYTGQIIFETDTGYLRVWNGSAWDYLSLKQTSWNLPQGLVPTTSGGTNGLGYVKGLTGQTVTAGTTADVTSSSMTFNAVSGRLYRYSTVGYAASTSISGLATLAATDASNNIQSVVYCNITNTSSGGGVALSYIFTATGSTTVKLRWQAITGNCTIYSSQAGYGITLEDIGPA